MNRRIVQNRGMHSPGARGRLISVKSQIRRGITQLRASAEKKASPFLVSFLSVSALRKPRRARCFFPTLRESDQSRGDETRRMLDESSFRSRRKFLRSRGSLEIAGQVSVMEARKNRRIFLRHSQMVIPPFHMFFINVYHALCIFKFATRASRSKFPSLSVSVRAKVLDHVRN